MRRKDRSKNCKDNLKKKKLSKLLSHCFKKQCDKSFDNLDDIEDMRKQAKKNMTRFQLEAKAEKEIGKRDAQIHVRLFSAPTNLNESHKTRAILRLKS